MKNRWTAIFNFPFPKTIRWFAFCNSTFHQFFGHSFAFLNFAFFSFLKISIRARTTSISKYCNYIFKGSNWNTRTMCEICSKLTIKAPERLGWVYTFGLVFKIYFKENKFNGLKILPVLSVKVKSSSSETFVQCRFKMTVMRVHL